MRYLQPLPAAPAPTETAVIVPVPAADPVVGAHRRRLDVAASWGVPAHVTVVYPFAPPEVVNDELVDTLAAVARTVPAFGCRFGRTRWFGEDVLWLDPDPDAPFRRLTAEVERAFPHYPPYGGAFPDPIPHLTVAERRRGDLVTLQTVELEVQRELPVSTRIDRVLLIAGAPAPQSWRTLHDLPLG
ncbi:MAG: 2'-5' RNA ligase family protein [Actinomycetes bacterium]